MKRLMKKSLIILLVSALSLIVVISFSFTLEAANKHQVEVRRAFSGSQDRIIDNSNYCSIDTSLMERLNLEVGDEIWVRVEGQYGAARYTIVESRDEGENVIRMGLRGRRRVDQDDSFTGRLSKVADNTKEVRVEKALYSLGLDDIVAKPDHVAVDKSLLRDLNLELGDKIRVRREDAPDKNAIYQIAETLDEGEAVIRLGLNGRRRLNQSDPFKAYINEVPDNPHDILSNFKKVENHGVLMAANYMDSMKGKSLEEAAQFALEDPGIRSFTYNSNRKLADFYSKSLPVHELDSFDVYNDYYGVVLNQEMDLVGTYEREVLRLVNQERKSRGIEPLEYDSELFKVARIKSEDMRDQDYYAHVSPTYGAPFEMLDHYGFKYSRASENIARGYWTPKVVVDGWMNSEGHRKNMLDPGYNKIGVGFAYDNDGSTYWTQLFIRN